VFCFFLFVALLIDVVPLWVFHGLLVDWARYERVRAGSFRWIAFVGWGLGLLAGHAAGVVVAARVLRSNDWVGFFVFLLGGLIGASIAPGLSYLALRARTRHDPDYEPLDED
jgi:hypothetical protein